MQFDIVRKSEKGNARAGTIKTYHGNIETPIFMPVGTVGTVKGVFQEHLISDTQAQIILGNTYHLFLRPGIELIKKAGGLHQFIGWEKPILTDSGGYQIFSLSENRKMSEEGAYFKSHIDGSRHMFTPESVVDIQHYLGSDFIMALDECTPYPCNKTQAKASMQLTHRWLKRGIAHHKQKEQTYEHKSEFCPIVQGSMYSDLRKESAQFIADQNMFINAIGGLSVGEPEEMMYEMCGEVCMFLPEEKPRYLMGVGTPKNVLENIAIGIDMFDCVMPTRNARNGMLFTSKGIINIKNKKWATDFTPIDKQGTSFVDLNYTKAYLRHLFAAKEMLGPQIASLHNLAFYLDLVKQARLHIIAGDFETWKNQVTPLLSRKL